MRWMKVCVLVAGLVGSLGFFRPFFTYRVNHETLEVSAYRILVGFGSPDLDAVLQNEATCAGPAFGNVPVDSCDEWATHYHRSFVPLFFLSAGVMVVVAAAGLVRRRLDGLSALMTLAAGLLALGGWLRELNVARPLLAHSGDALLAISGAIATLASAALLWWPEPKRVAKPAKRPLPEARVVR